MGREPRAIGATVRDQDPYRNGSRLPAPVARDLPRETLATIHGAHQAVDIDDLRLEFDHKQCSSSRVPGQDIDDTALPEDRVRDLGREDPRWKSRREPPGHGLVETGVPSRDQSVQIAAAPAGRQPDLDLQDTGDVQQGPDRDAFHMTTLHVRDYRPIDTRPDGHVDLAPTALDAHRSERGATSLEGIHGTQSVQGLSPDTYRASRSSTTMPDVHHGNLARRNDWRPRRPRGSARTTGSRQAPNQRRNHVNCGR